MVKSRQMTQGWCRSTQPLGLIVGGVCLGVVWPALAGVNEIAQRDVLNASVLVAEEASWLPDEERGPGIFPDGPPSELGAAKLHYIDTAGEERTSVLVYMEPTTARRGIERNKMRTLAARAGGLVQYEYDIAMPGVMNLRDIPGRVLKAAMSYDTTAQLRSPPIFTP